MKILKCILASVLAILMLSAFVCCKDNSNDGDSYYTEKVASEQTGNNNSSSDTDSTYSDTTSNNDIREPIMDDLAKAYKNLTNSLYLLKEKKNITVGYLGGSITVGIGSSDVWSNTDTHVGSTTGWRPLTTKWLKRQFPDATITEIQDAIGNTGSLFGLYRAEERYFSQNSGKAPDLNFFEFAVNDLYEKRSVDADGGSYGTPNNYQYVQLESLIKKVYKSNPKANIVFVITGDVGYLLKEANSDTPVLGAAFHELADYYDIPIVFVFRELVLQMKKEATASGNILTNPGQSDATRKIWLKYFPSGDYVHPNNIGHRHYSNTVTSYLDNAFDYIGDVSANDYKDVTFPQTTYCAENNINGGIIYPDATMSDFSKFQNKNDWAVSGFRVITGDSIAAEFGAYQGTNTYIQSENQNDTVTFTFNSSSVGICSYSTDSTIIEYSIDGGTIITKTLEAERELYTLATDLGDGPHTITIKHCSSNHLKIYYILFRDGN